MSSSDAKRVVVGRVLTLWPRIVVAARARQVPEDILGGLVCQESSGIPSAKRHEPHYKWLWGIKPGQVIRLPPGLRLVEDLELQKYSYGLCQVMGAVAREYGYIGHLAELLNDTATNLDLGARHLAAKIKLAHGDLRGGLQAYNSGIPTIKGPDSYCFKVEAWAANFKQRS